MSTIKILYINSNSKQYEHELCSGLTLQYLYKIIFVNWTGQQLFKCLCAFTLTCKVYYTVLNYSWYDSLAKGDWL